MGLPGSEEARAWLRMLTSKGRTWLGTTVHLTPSPFSLWSNDPPWRPVWVRSFDNLTSIRPRLWLMSLSWEGLGQTNLLELAVQCIRGQRTGQDPRLDRRHWPNCLLCCWDSDLLYQVILNSPDFYFHSHHLYVQQRSDTSAFGQKSPLFYLCAKGRIWLFAKWNCF